ncbi:MAG: MMPL family transporter, partial [bacterium]
LNDKVIEKFNFSSDVTMMTAKSLAENYQLTKKAKNKSSISYVESISDFLPTATEQNQRRPEIMALNNTMRAQKIQPTVSAEAREQIVAEIERLEMNVIEMQDMAFIGGQDQVTDKTNRLVGNPDQPENDGNLSALVTLLNQQPIAAERVSQFSRDFAKAYQNTVLDMADTSRITVEMLPNFIRDKYMSKNGERFLMTLYPKGDVWNMSYLERFTNEVLDVSPSISGTPPMFYYMLKIIGDDGRRASLLTLLVVFVFLLIDFKSIKYALIAMTPLLFGMVWMVGFMGLAGIQLTLLNVIALPLIIGIGIDDGVHVLHRYRIEGPGTIDRVYRSTGKAIIITSLTTMLAFGSLVFATYRGFGSMGLALFIGVGMCLAATIAILPAILAILERRE